MKKKTAMAALFAENSQLKERVASLKETLRETLVENRALLEANRTSLKIIQQLLDLTDEDIEEDLPFPEEEPKEEYCVDDNTKINTVFLDDISYEELKMALFTSGVLIRTMVDQGITHLSYYDMCEIARAAQHRIDSADDDDEDIREV